MVQKYFTWNPKKVDDNTFRHPASYSDWFPEGIDIIETEYFKEGVSGLVEDRTYLGILEYPSGWFTTINVDNLKVKAGTFNVVPRTPEEVIGYLNSFYPSPDGEDDYFVLDVDNFTIIDYRPVVEE